MIISSKLKKLSQIFHLTSPLYVVGGYVRDFLLQKHTEDIDITSYLSTQEVVDLLRGTEYETIVVNEKLGTILIRVDDESYEYTPFRKDNYPSDGSHTPSDIQFGVTQKDDYLRRDFTINALYYDIENDRIIDFGTGIKDIDLRLIKAVRNPEQVFTEDALRILRMIRFSAILGFNIDENTLFAGKKCAKLINSLSKERIIEEYKKTIEKVSFDEMFNYINLLIDEEVIENLYRKKVQVSSFHTSDGLIVYAPNIVFFYQALFERCFYYTLDYVTGCNLDTFEDIERIEKEIFNTIDEIFKNDKLSNVERRDIKEFISFTRLICEVKNQRNIDLLISHYYNIINRVLNDKQSRIMVRNRVILSIVQRFYTLNKTVPLQVKDLSINGLELQELNVKKEDTSKVLKKLLSNVVLGEVKNTKEELIKVVLEDKLC